MALCSVAILAGLAGNVAAFRLLPCERFKSGAGAVATLRSGRGKGLRPFPASVAAVAPALQGVCGTCNATLTNTTGETAVNPPAGPRPQQSNALPFRAHTAFPRADEEKESPPPLTPESSPSR